MKRPYSILSAALIACAFAVPSARANVLVYDGFDLSRGYKGGDITKNSQPSSTYLSAQTGFAAKVWDNWSETGVLYVHGSGNGLTYPSSGWEGFSAVDSSIGFNHTNNGGDNRTGYRELAPVAAFSACGKLYFRILAKCTGTASNLKAGSVYGLGLCNDNPGVNGKTGTFGSTGLWLGIKHVSGGTLKAVVNILGTQYELCTMNTNETYVLVAEVSVGAGAGGADQVRAFAVSTASYAKNSEYWASSVGTDGVAEATLVRNAAKQLQYLVLNGEYGTRSVVIALDEVFVGTELGDVVPVSKTAPRLSDGSLSLSGGNYTATAILTNSAANVSYVLSNGSTATTNAVGAYVNGDTVFKTFATPTDNTTYEVLLTAENAGGETAELSLGTIYGGTLALTKVSDGNELGLAPAALTVSRANPDPLPLVVNYAFADGTAVAGVNYVDNAGSVTIPANESSATITVTPIVDAATATDTSLTVFIAAGNYDAPSGVAVTIANFTTPAGCNYWVGGTATDGKYLASTAANWSMGRAPTATENIVFNGDFSTADCEWDSAASATVASWTQTNGYTGTVTFDTEFPDYSGATFTLFTISGDCGLYSGKWSCRGNYNNFGASVTPMNTTKTAKRWCLNVAVGGAMTVASGTAITATGRGYGYTSGSQSASPAYGGYAWGGGFSPYGSIKEPFEPGLGALAQGDQKNRISAIGGGAIKLAVAGLLTLDGSIVALGTADQNIARAGGTGGSIWISASQISGAGKIDASAPTGIGNDQIMGTGSGGRIALYTQSALAFPIANVVCSGTGYRGTSWQWNSCVSGPGTIYVYDPTQTDGTLYVKQSTTVSTQNTKWTGTPVMGDLALDAVVLSGCASLRIPEGTSLTLPSLAAVTTSNSGSGSAGLVYDGGTLNIGSGDQTLKANVAFSSPTAFSFPGNLMLETGAKLGSLNSMYGTSAHCYDQTFTVSVAGDLTIPAGAYAGATRCCALTAGSTGRRTASHGGQSLYLAAEARTNGFDSIVSPTMPGGSMNSSFPAGGVFTLTVGGTLTLDGSISADGGGARGSDSTYNGASAGAGGTLNVTAGALAGEGKMSAEGGCGRWNYAGGAGGGRIAVRLTKAGAAFPDHWKTNVTAYGESFSGGNGKASSAGTVYLQEAANGEAGGLVVIRNDLAVQAAAANNNAATRYPGNGDGCDAPAALKKTSLLAAGAAHVEFTDSMKFATLEIESGSSIDLSGKTLTVKSAKLGDTKLSIGTYAAGDEAVAGFVTDSGEGGELVVTGGGFFLFVR